MANIPSAVSKRLVATIPKFKKILLQAREMDVNESDTVTIVTDMLEQIFGFDKYTEITREYAIQGTYCDLAVKSEKEVDYLVEVKAIGIKLKDIHLKQAVNYASREGIKWVVLTNGVEWEVHRVTLAGKVENELVFTLDFAEINPRKTDEQDLLYMLCKRGVRKDLIDDLYEYRQSVNRYTIGALLLTDSVASTVRKELRKLKPGIRVEVDEIADFLRHEVLKREILETEAGKEAERQVAKMLKSQQKAKLKAKSNRKQDLEASAERVPEPESETEEAYT